MNLKVHAKPSGIPTCEVMVADGATEFGVRTVTVFVRTIDAFNVSKMAASLRLSPDEARELANRLLAVAGSPEGA